MNLVIPAFAGSLAGLGAYKMYSLSRINGEPTERIPHNLSIIMPTLNEEHHIRGALESLKTQSLLQCDCRDGNRVDEIIVVDSDSSDNTAELARLYGCKVVTAPMGKLTARNIGTANAHGDIIVSVDADTLYPKNWLFLLCRHFNNPEVAAVAGSTYFYDSPHFAYKFMRSIGNMSGGLVMMMPGQNSAFRKDAFLNVGGLNDAVNQQNIWSTWMEEEFAFPRRLSTQGKFVFDHQAVVFTSPRRYQCDANKSQYCEDISGIYGEREMSMRMAIRQ